jgi:hypothetical protein
MAWRSPAMSTMSGWTIVVSLRITLVGAGENLAEPVTGDVGMEERGEPNAHPLMRRPGRRRQRQLAVVDLVALAVVRERRVIRVREDDSRHRRPL